MHALLFAQTQGHSWSRAVFQLAEVGMELELPSALEKVGHSRTGHVECSEPSSQRSLGEN